MQQSLGVTRMRKVRRDISNMNHLESDNKLVTYQYWTACSLLDLKADPHTRMRNGGACMCPPEATLLSVP